MAPVHTSSPKNAFHRGHEWLVLSVAELVAVVGRLADLARDEEGQAGYYDVHDRKHRLEAHRLRVGRHGDKDSRRCEQNDEKQRQP